MPAYLTKENSQPYYYFYIIRPTIIYQYTIMSNINIRRRISRQPYLFVAGLASVGVLSVCNWQVMSTIMIWIVKDGRWSRPIASLLYIYQVMLILTIAIITTYVDSFVSLRSLPTRILSRILQHWGYCNRMIMITLLTLGYLLITPPLLLRKLRGV